MSISRIKRIQKALKLDADGVIGPATLSALENQIFNQNKAQASGFYSMTVSEEGFYQLIEHEISSPAYYQRRLQRPIWPGGASGVTLGIGYDCGYHRDYQIRRDWQAYLDDKELSLLLTAAGKKGREAQALVKKLRSIKVPYETAARVFSESTLPDYAKATRKTYKGIEKCVPDVQAAILSLVYNRGTRLSGSKRKEMKTIQNLIKHQRYVEISEQIQSMKRLWLNTGLSGLLKRRDDEARLVSEARQQYDWQRLIRV